MPKPDPVEKLRAAYKAWHDTRGASADVWMALMANDVRLRSIADGAPGMEFSAPRAGKAAAHGYFSSLAADWELLEHTADEFITDGDRVVVFGSVTIKHRRTGKTVLSLVVHRWKFRDGLAIEFFEFYDTAQAFAAATPDPALSKIESPSGTT